MNSINSFRKAMGIASSSTRLFQHQLFVDPEDCLAKKVAGQYVEALSAIHPTLAKIAAPLNIGSEKISSFEQWQEVVEAGIQVTLPETSSRRKPIAMFVVSEFGLSSTEQQAQLGQFITRIRDECSECWLIGVGDTSTDWLAGLNNAGRLQSESASSMALSTMLIPRVTGDGKLQIEEDLIQTATHALLLPVLCDSDGDRFVHPEMSQTNHSSPITVEATGVLGTKSRMVDQLVPSIIKQIIRTSPIEERSISLPSPIDMLNRAVQGTLPFNAKPLISNRSDQLDDDRVPCLVTSSQRFTISLFKPSESARIETVRLGQRPQWLTEFANLVTQDRVSKLYELIAERLDRHFDDSVQELTGHLSSQVLNESALEQLGDHSRGLVATRQVISVSSGDTIDIQQAQAAFTEAIAERQRTIFQAVLITTLVTVTCVAGVFGALLYAPAFWFGPLAIAIATIGGLAIRCWSSHRKMLRLQEQILESIQREAQAQLCSQLHRLLEHRFSELDAQIKGGIEGLKQSGNSIRDAFVQSNAVGHAGPATRFQKVPVSSDLAASCHQWFFKSCEMREASDAWSTRTDEIVKKTGVLAYKGLPPQQVVNRLREEVSQILAAKLPPADLWRALTRNEFSELDRKQLAEIGSHCNQAVLKQFPAAESKAVWIVPHSLRPHLQLDETSVITALPERIVFIRLA